MKTRIGFVTILLLVLFTTAAQCQINYGSNKQVGTVREFEQAAQDYNFAKVNSLLMPDARSIEASSLLDRADDWQWFEKAIAVGVRITYQPHDFETHVQGDVAWVTMTLDSTFSADNAEGQKLLQDVNSDIAKEECSSQGTLLSCGVTYVDSVVLVKTPSGWKVALGHSTSRLLKAQK